MVVIWRMRAKGEVWNEGTHSAGRILRISGRYKHFSSETRHSLYFGYRREGQNHAGSWMGTGIIYTTWTRMVAIDYKMKMNSIANTNNMELAIGLEGQSFSHSTAFRCKPVTKGKC